jgi:hypothetical protein
VKPTSRSRIEGKLLRTKRNLSYLNIQSAPRSKHTTVSLIQNSQLMLYREIIAACSEIHTKHINALCGQNVELLNVKLVVHIVTNGPFKGIFLNYTT